MATFRIPNSSMVNSPDNFRSAINRYGSGLAKACRYMVVIGQQKLAFRWSTAMQTTHGDLPFLCEQAELPGKALTVNDARYYGPNFKYPVQTEYADITMTFLVRDQMYEKEYFDNWMMTINPNDSYDFSYKSDYVSQINIIQYSEGVDTNSKMISTYMLTLVDAFPISVAPMGLVWGEEGFHRIAVTFAYTEYKRPDDLVRAGYSLVETGPGGVSKMVTGSTLGSVTKSLDFGGRR